MSGTEHPSTRGVGPRVPAHDPLVWARMAPSSSRSPLLGCLRALVADVPARHPGSSPHHRHPNPGLAAADPCSPRTTASILRLEMAPQEPTATRFEVRLGAGASPCPREPSQERLSSPQGRETAIRPPLMGARRGGSSSVTVAAGLLAGASRPRRGKPAFMVSCRASRIERRPYWQRFARLRRAHHRLPSPARQAPEAGVPCRMRHRPLGIC